MSQDKSVVEITCDLTKLFTEAERIVALICSDLEKGFDALEG